MSVDGSFSDTHKDFVLKLKFVDSNATESVTQIRRVRLPRITNPEGQVSYEELVGLAVSFVIPEDRPEDFTVQLTYQDVDDDTVVIGSSEELLDALEQYADQRVLYVTAVVQVNRAAAQKSASNTIPVAPPVEGNVSRPPTEGTPVLQNVVESVVNIILNAAVAMNTPQQGSATASSSTQTSAPIFYAPDGMPSTMEEPNVADSVASVSEDQTVSKTENKPVAKKEESPRRDPEQQPKPREEEVLFAHPHHTCDGCLATPIFGTRYRATHKHDFDLCEACYGKVPVREVNLFLPVSGGDGFYSNNMVYTCDGCCASPISGTRYHATHKGNFDLCEKCFEKVLPNECSSFIPMDGSRKVGTPPKTVAVPNEENVQSNTNPEENVSSSPAKDSETDEKLSFIHGRHTCDGCLVTPIVGKRFHAKNKCDYDLCEKCYTNYRGDDIQFEVEELDRDARLQPRWRRRRNRMMQHRRDPYAEHAKALGGFKTARGYPGPRSYGRRRTQFLTQQQKATKGEGRAQEKAATGGVNEEAALTLPVAPTDPPESKVSSAMPSEKSNDADMEMAIRRSLEDEKAKNRKASNDLSPDDLAMEVAISMSLEEERALMGAKEEASAAKDEAASRDQTDEARKPAPEPSAPTEEMLRSISSIGSNASAAFKAFEDNIDDPDAAPNSVVVETVKEGGNDDMAVSDDFVAPNTNDPTAPSESFASDADDPVSDLLGSTLDKCALAIDAMVKELERSSSSKSASSASSEKSYVGVTVEDSQEGKETTMQEASLQDSQNCGKEKHMEWVKELNVRANAGTNAAPHPVSQEADNVEETAGATIVESDEDKKDLTEPSEEGWHVVSDANQTDTDEELARAAQMIGSALFNSDMKSSGEVVSTLTEGSAGPSDFSMASSVPTTVHSLVSGSQVTAAQMERWAPELLQLRELGLDDDMRCVEILERLTAANIGCDNNDEVTVQHVVEKWYAEE